MRRSAAYIELCLGILGVGQLLFALFTLPMGGLFLFSALPPLLLGYVGLTELLVLAGVGKSRFPYTTVNVLVLSSVIVGATLAFPYLGIASIGRRVPIAVFVLWPFFNTFVFLPFVMKAGVLVLLASHLGLLAFTGVEEEQKTRVWLARSVTTAVICFLLLSIGRFARLENTYRSLLDVERLNAAELGNGGLVKDRYVLEIGSDQLAGGLHSLSALEAVKHHSFRITNTSVESNLFVDIGLAATEQSAKQQYDERLRQLVYLPSPKIQKNPIDLVGAEGIIAVRERESFIRYEAFVRKDRAIIEIAYRRSDHDPEVPFDEFRTLVKAIVSSAITK